MLLQAVCSPWGKVRLLAQVLVLLQALLVQLLVASLVVLLVIWLDLKSGKQLLRYTKRSEIER